MDELEYSRRVQELIDAGMLTEDGFPPIIVSNETAEVIDRWAEEKGLPTPTKNMIVINLNKDVQTENA